MVIANDCKEIMVEQNKISRGYRIWIWLLRWECNGTLKRDPQRSSEDWRKEVSKGMRMCVSLIENELWMELCQITSANEKQQLKLMLRRIGSARNDSWLIHNRESGFHLDCLM
jgi:hypothetical protein